MSLIRDIAGPFQPLDRVVARFRQHFVKGPRLAVFIELGLPAPGYAVEYITGINHNQILHQLPGQHLGLVFVRRGCLRILLRKPFDQLDGLLHVRLKVFDQLQPVHARQECEEAIAKRSARFGDYVNGVDRYSVLRCRLLHSTSPRHGHLKPRQPRIEGRECLLRVAGVAGTDDKGLIVEWTGILEAAKHFHRRAACLHDYRLKIVCRYGRPTHAEMHHAVNVSVALWQVRHRHGVPSLAALLGHGSQPDPQP